MGKERVFSVFGVRFYVLFEVSGKIVRWRDRNYLDFWVCRWSFGLRESFRSIGRLFLGLKIFRIFKSDLPGFKFLWKSYLDHQFLLNCEFWNLTKGNRLIFHQEDWRKPQKLWYFVDLLRQHKSMKVFRVIQ